MAHQGSKYDNSDDRFYMYQWIDKLEYWLLKLPKPDYTIFLKMPYNYLEQVSFPFQRQEEIKAYLELARLYNWDKIECVKEDKIKNKEEIHKEIIALLQTKGVIK